MSGEIRAVVVTRDSEMIDVFSDGFRSLGVKTEPVDDMIQATNPWLRSKIEAIVLDFDSLGDEVAIFTELRKNPSNRSAILIGVATRAPTKEVAFRTGARFILQRPFIADDVDRAIRATHHLILQGRREYFRLAISVPVSVRRSTGRVVECKSINLSRKGMAIDAPELFAIGESLDLTFSVPDSEFLSQAQATVVWDDKHGKAGLRFECVNSNVEQHLYTWLDDQCLMWHKVS